jgi:hypothetical protein
MSIAAIGGNVFRTSAEGIGLGAGVTLPGDVTSLLNGQTWVLSGGYAVRDYRNNTV